MDNLKESLVGCHDSVKASHQHLHTQEVNDATEAKVLQYLFNCYLRAAHMLIDPQVSRPFVKFYTFIFHIFDKCVCVCVVIFFQIKKKLFSIYLRQIVYLQSTLSLFFFFFFFFFLLSEKRKYPLVFQNVTKQSFITSDLKKKMIIWPTFNY